MSRPAYGRYLRHMIFNLVIVNRIYSPGDMVCSLLARKRLIVTYLRSYPSIIFRVHDHVGCRGPIVEREKTFLESGAQYQVIHSQMRMT